MDLHHDHTQFVGQTQFLGAIRRDGWSPASKARFLSLLADSGNVRLCARRCGLSAQSAYVQRRRDPLFARAWAGALVLARDHAEQVLADRAIEGVEEPIFYRGEQVGTRRRYDNRLLLAHLARLDRIAQDEDASGAAGRFDEMLAVVAGHAPPEALMDGDEDGPLPPERADYATAAAKDGEEEADAALARPSGDTSAIARDQAVFAAGDAAFVAAGQAWDGWFADACAVVDGLGDDAPPMEFKSRDGMGVRPAHSLAFPPMRRAAANFGARSFPPRAPATV